MAYDSDELEGRFTVLDSRRLLYFYEVARLGSFSRAEDFLDIAQPALSRQVQALETELGAILLDRYGRGVKLTDVGQAVFEKTAHIFSLMDDVRTTVNVTREDPTGDVRLGVIPSVAATIATKLIMLLRTRHPKIRLQVSEGHTGHVHSLLINGDVDIGVLVGPSPNKTLLQEELLAEELYLIGSPDHPIMAQKSFPVKQLVELPLVLPSAPFGSRRVFDRIAKRKGIEFKPLVEVDSLTVLKDLVRSTPPMFTILPRIAVAAELAAGVVAAIPLQPKAASRLMLASRKAKPMSRAVRIVAELISKLILESDNTARMGNRMAAAKHVSHSEAL
ncbi:LysR family transcriptional regulator [Sphingomonas sp. SRS2]|uniref:LysR family transcriptional regulator n=1 Tax=Sphingomonas sp. SRS2 TaxID=133190 RepID=UPI0006184AFE|nr:LysR family transcriptional regulator [Sphingomonas sp. SRS2]KKC26190.1 hypothetical protein WP12_09900 [Sphingomonas sp. SRS2]